MDDQLHSFHPAPDTAAPTRPRRRVVRILRLSLVALALLAVLAGGTLYWLDARHYESTDDAFIDAYTSQIAPRVAGQVTALLFADNQHVTAGQVLVRIDPRDYQAKLDQALAQQASAEATLQQAQAQLAVQQANLRQTEANIAAAQADLTQARQDFDRFKTINPAAVTRQQVDTATGSFHAAQARLEAAQAGRGAAGAQVQAAEAQIAAAEASVKQAQASTNAARLQLSYCTIVAPVSGVVTHRTIDVGNYVSLGQPMFALVQDGRWVIANFKETQLADMRPGQEVSIDIDAVPAETFRGRVDSFQTGTGSVFSTLPAENATGNYVKIVQRVPVKIVFEDDRVHDYPLAPGMSVIPRVRVR